MNSSSLGLAAAWQSMGTFAILTVSQVEVTTMGVTLAVTHCSAIVARQGVDTLSG